MSGHDIIVVGASAGGLEALRAIVAELPADLPAAVFCAMHVAPTGRHYLPHLLDSVGKLHAAHAEDREEIANGRIYVAPPDHHMLLRRGFIRVNRGPRENGHRPAVDPLFRSAAVAYGPRVVGVILTGNLDDGTRGLSAVKRCGGLAVVQDPEDALYPSMPASARQNTDADYCVPLSEIAGLLTALTRVPAGAAAEPPPVVKLESRMSEREDDEDDVLDRIATRSSLTCPECHGALWELKDGNLLNFRCHIGHAFSPDTLINGHSKDLESTLWAAIRGFEESAMIAERIADRHLAEGGDRMRQKFMARAQAAHEHAQKLRQLIDGLPVTAD